MLTEARRSEDFLELLKRDRRGRLKVYIGFAAGVGKTYRMLGSGEAMLCVGAQVDRRASPL